MADPSRLLSAPSDAIKRRLDRLDEVEKERDQLAHRVDALRNHLSIIANTWTGKASRQAERAIVKDDVQAERDRGGA